MYNCRVCKRVSEPRQPRLVFIVYKIDDNGLKQIEREIPVCIGCKERLGKVFSGRVVVKQKGMKSVMESANGRTERVPYRGVGRMGSRE